jgi:hypothetical protein
VSDRSIENFSSCFGKTLQEQFDCIVKTIQKGFNHVVRVENYNKNSLYIHRFNEGDGEGGFFFDIEY